MKKQFKILFSVLLVSVLVLSTMVFSTVLASAETTGVAKIGETTYDTLAAAFGAAQDGDEIVVTGDIHLTGADATMAVDTGIPVFHAADGKSISIDLNGKKLTADVSDFGSTVYAFFGVANGGSLTINDSKGTASVSATTGTNKMYCLLMNYEADGTLVVNGGSYYLEQASDSLVYAGKTNDTYINGGTYDLGNVGTGSNGSPWIFNTVGRNSGYTINVNSGSFRTDVQHQHWMAEAIMPRTKALSYDANTGFYTTVDASIYAIEGTHNIPVGYATLADAVARALDGSTIVIPAGVYTDAYNFATVNKTLTISGEEGTVLKGGLALGSDNNKLDKGVVTIQGITFEGVGVTLKELAGVTVTDCVFNNVSGDAISVLSDNLTASTTITNNEINSAKVGINLRTPLAVTISGNTISNTQHNSITIQHGSAYATSDAAVSITGNKLSNWGLGGEGRALRLAFGSTAGVEKSVTISENEMTHAGTAPEEFAKITANDTAAVSLNANYWNGFNPKKVEDLLNTPASTTLTTYYKTVADMEAGKTSDPNFTPTVQIGDQKFETLEEAVASIPQGTTDTPTTITLLENISTKPLIIGYSYPVNVIIDLNGFTVSSTDKLFTVYRAGTTLTLTNGTVKGNSSGGTINVAYGSKLVLGENLTIHAGGGAGVGVKISDGVADIATPNGVKVLGGKVAFVAENEANLPAQASIDDVYYATLLDAIAASQDRDLIVIESDIFVDIDDVITLDGAKKVFFKIMGKEINLDLNGKLLSGDAAGIDGLFSAFFATENGGSLIFHDSKGTGKIQLTANGTNVETLLLNSESDCKIMINGGTFELDVASDALIYTVANEGVIVNGGTFLLGNVGTRENFSPWIFNARGKNIRHVMVYGGTFNDDIQHQYYPFEVLVDKNVALKKENGLFISAPAVAYVDEHEFSGNWYTNEIGYATIEEALAAIRLPRLSWDGKQYSGVEGITLLTDIKLSSTLVIDKPCFINGNGYTLTSTATRAINVNCAPSIELTNRYLKAPVIKETPVTIYDLTVNAAGERGVNLIQKPAIVKLENVTIAAANYAVNIASSAQGATLSINACTLTGLNVVNLAAADITVTVVDSTLNCNDRNDAEGYSALTLGKEGDRAYVTASNVIFNIMGDSLEARNSSETGTLIVSDGEIARNEAYILYDGPYYYSFATLAKALEKAVAGDTIVLLQNVTIDASLLRDDVTIDYNGYTLNGQAQQ